MLKEAEEQKQKAEDEKSRQKALRQQLHMQNRGLNSDQVSLLALAASAQKRSGDFEKKVVAKSASDAAVKGGTLIFARFLFSLMALTISLPHDFR